MSKKVSEKALLLEVERCARLLVYYKQDANSLNDFKKQLNYALEALSNLRAGKEKERQEREAAREKSRLGIGRWGK